MAGAEMMEIFGVRVPVAPRRRETRVRFRSVREGGIVWEYVSYPTMQAASEATGLSVSTLRWRLERR